MADVPEQTGTNRRLYIVKLESYWGALSGLQCYEVQDEWNHEELPEMYVVICATPEGASVVDYGYRTQVEAKAAWPDAIASAE